MSMDLPQIPRNEPGLAVVAKADKLSLAPLTLRYTHSYWKIGE